MSKKKKKIETLGDFVEEFNRLAQEEGRPEATPIKETVNSEVSVHFISQK